MVRAFGAIVLITSALAAPVAAQVPVPFPRPGQPSAPQTPATTPAPGTRPPQPLPAAGQPSEITLGAPIYPAAQFLMSYDAGQGQRYYLFGSETDFAQVVTFYKTMLKQKGELVFEEPPVHMFDTGRFREETMAFPPSVTVKDYAWGGSAGYLNPKRGATPARFKTIIQIVPAPPGAAK